MPSLSASAAETCLAWLRLNAEERSKWNSPSGRIQVRLRLFLRHSPAPHAGQQETDHARPAPPVASDRPRLVHSVPATGSTWPCRRKLPEPPSLPASGGSIEMRVRRWRMVVLAPGGQTHWREMPCPKCLLSPIRDLFIKVWSGVQAPPPPRNCQANHAPRRRRRR